MPAYYNEIDPFAAQWLRNLIAAGHIALGDVDERSITEIKPDELKHYTQCHFFAGIGVWSYALRRAGWGDSRPVWTGSCPCQPFSAAGKGKGIDDERHLWPAWFELVSKRQPTIIFGEQVASSEVIGKSDGTGENAWLDIVSTDLERASYSVASFDLPAAGFGAPHIRQRAWFAAEKLGNSDNQRLERYGRSIKEYDAKGWQGAERHAGPSNLLGELADTNGRDSRAKRKQRCRQYRQLSADSSSCHETRPAGAVNGFWRSADWIGCRDDKFRPVEPGTFPLVNGATQRMGRLRAYGNAICAEVATGFITAYMGSN
jgi:DNA (cytosine-5)-methyltransferase 1